MLEINRGAAGWSFTFDLINEDGYLGLKMSGNTLVCQNGKEKKENETDIGV